MRKLKATEKKGRQAGCGKFGSHVVFAGESTIVISEGNYLTRVPGRLGEGLAVMQPPFPLSSAVKVNGVKDPRGLDFSNRLHTVQPEGSNRATRSGVVTIIKFMNN